MSARWSSGSGCLPPLLPLLLLLGACAGTRSPCTNREYRWVIKGQDGCCPRCGPGKYLTKRCENFKAQAMCGTCQNGHFSDTWNTYSSCAPCGTCLEAQGFQVEKECNAKSDVKCSCRPGYTPDTSKRCMKICDKGEQLKPGDSNTCEQCPDGFYSDQKGTKSCKPWTRCNDTSQRGSATQDAICGPAKSDATTVSKGSLSIPETTYRTTLLRTTAVSEKVTRKSTLMEDNLLFICVMVVAAVMLVVVVLRRMMPCKEENPGFQCCFGDRNYTKPPVPVQEEFNDITSVQVKN